MRAQVLFAEIVDWGRGGRAETTTTTIWFAVAVAVGLGGFYAF